MQSKRVREQSKKIKNLRKKMHGGMIKMMTKNSNGMMAMKESWGDEDNKTSTIKSDDGKIAMLDMATTEEWL